MTLSEEYSVLDSNMASHILHSPPPSHLPLHSYSYYNTSCSKKKRGRRDKVNREYFVYRYLRPLNYCRTLDFLLKNEPWLQRRKRSQKCCVLWSSRSFPRSTTWIFDQMVRPWLIKLLKYNTSNWSLFTVIITKTSWKPQVCWTLILACKALRCDNSSLSSHRTRSKLNTGDVGRPHPGRKWGGWGGVARAGRGWTRVGLQRVQKKEKRAAGACLERAELRAPNSCTTCYTVCSVLSVLRLLDKNHDSLQNDNCSQIMHNRSLRLIYTKLLLDYTPRLSYPQLYSGSRLDQPDVRNL